MEIHLAFKLLPVNENKSLQTRTDDITNKMAAPNSTFAIGG